MTQHGTNALQSHWTSEHTTPTPILNKDLQFFHHSTLANSCTPPSPSLQNTSVLQSYMKKEHSNPPPVNKRAQQQYTKEHGSPSTIQRNTAILHHSSTNLSNTPLPPYKAIKPFVITLEGTTELHYIIIPQFFITILHNKTVLQYHNVEHSSPSPLHHPTQKPFTTTSSSTAVFLHYNEQQGSSLPLH